jgi:hypothetical protein
MNQPDLRDDRSDPMLKRVHEGMKVYDRQDKEIGTVETVFIGSVTSDDAQMGRGPASINPADEEMVAENRPLLFDFAFGGAVSPAGDEAEAREMIRGRLLREGYVEVDGAGLFAKDMFILPDQIQSVSEDSVHLSVSKDELITKP